MIDDSWRFYWQSKVSLRSNNKWGMGNTKEGWKEV